MNAMVKVSPAATAMSKAAVHRDPDTNTEMMRSSLRQCGVEIVVKHKTSFQTDPKTNELSGWRSVADGALITLAEGANLARAQEVINAAMAPADEGDMEVWLSELGLITAKRNMGDASAELFLVAYTKRLADYPADIVRDTLMSWSGKWFPTWGELKEILDARTAERGVIRTAFSVHTAVTARAMSSEPFEPKGKTPDERHAELMREAHFIRRSDPERARELEQQALDELAAGRTH